MRLIIAGTRKIGQANCLRIIEKVVPELVAAGHEVTEIISGGSGHADSAGEIYAQRQGIALKRFRANWSAHGGQAGPFRNAEMAKYAAEQPDGHLLLIWNGYSNGSASMKHHAKYRLLTILEYILSEGGEILQEPKSLRPKS